MMFSTLAQGLSAQSRDDRRIGFIDGADKIREITFAEVRRRAIGLLWHFKQRGIKPGDELVISTSNNLAFVDAFWACQFGGIVPVPIAPGVSAEQRHKLFRVFRLLNNPYLYTDHQTGARIRALSDQLGNDTEYAGLKSKTILTETISDLDQITPAAETGPNDIALIQFSSGSTSDPKGVVLTQHNLVTNIRDIHSATGLSDRDMALSWMPLTHDMGLIGFHLAMLLTGTNHHIMATEAFVRRPLLWLQSASDLKASLLCSPNFGYRLFLKAFARWDIEDLDLSPVRLIFNGAEPVSAELCRQFMDTLAPYGLRRAAMMPVYGLAEATVAVTFPALNDTFHTVRVQRDSVGLNDSVTDSSADNAMEIAAVGHPVEHCQLRITGNDGTVFPDNQVGRIQIHGDNVTDGYYARPRYDRVAHTEDDWLDTGDIGFLREGRLYVTGRVKDLMFVNGQNIYAHDLESVICEHSALDLGKVVVCSVPTDEGEESIVVFVLHFGDASEFLTVESTVRGVVAEHTGIEAAVVVPVERIPKTTSGKLQRFALRKAFIDKDFDDALTEIAALRSTSSRSDHDFSRMERKLIDICASSLDGVRLDKNDNFFEIGMNSLKLVEIHELLDEHFPGYLEISDMFDHPTLARLAGFLEQKTGGG